VHLGYVIAFVECGRLRLELALAYALQEVVSEARLMRSRRLDLPRDGKLGSGADGKVQLPAVEAAPLAGRDGGAVPPGGVGIAVALALSAALGDVALTVRVGRHIGGVNGDVLPVLGKLGAQRVGETAEAGVNITVRGATPEEARERFEAAALRAAELRAKSKIRGNTPAEVG
jgi:cobalamin synthase